jgi:glutamate decarboxylase
MRRRTREDLTINPLFTRVGEATTVGRYAIPDGEMLPETAYQIIHDEVMLDGNARLNLATFVGTYMNPYALRLYAETFDKNMIDKDEYPRTAEIEDRCWKMLARSAPRRSARPRPACSAAWR